LKEREQLKVDVATHYYLLRDYSAVLKYSELFFEEKSEYDDMVRYIEVKSAYKDAWRTAQCPDKCNKIEKGIALYEAFERAGWSGNKKKKAYKYYNRLLNLKQQLILKQ
jgi:hypothetical protein